MYSPTSSTSLQDVANATTFDFPPWNIVIFLAKELNRISMLPNFPSKFNFYQEILDIFNGKFS